jgi:lipopolysaccharide export LptBFGC system permease protein LptF
VKGTALQKVIPNLPLPAPVVDGLTPPELLGTLTQTDFSGDRIALPNPSEVLRSLQERLRKELIKVDNQVICELHSRLVFGLGCVPLILTGICLGILFRGGHILSAFGASMIPAAVLMVFILSGKQLTRNSAVPTEAGIAVMWGGLALLMVLAWLLYRKISRV